MLLSTHWLDMAASLCDRVVVLQRGRLVASGAPAELCAQTSAARGSPQTLEQVFLQRTGARETGS